MEEKVDSQFQQLYKGCLSNERPSELLLLWRRRIESMMSIDDIYFLGIYTVVAYLHYPMNLINEVRFLRIFCHLHLEEKIKKQRYEKNNFSLHQKQHSFDIFNMFDMYTFVMGIPPLTNEERYTILMSLTYEEKRFLMNNLYPDFSEADFAIESSFQFKAFEAFLATDEEFEDPLVKYSEYEKFKYLCLNCKVFTSRCLWTSILTIAILFNQGFLVTLSGMGLNLIFFQFGFLVDKMLFQVLYSRVKNRENVDTCRRVWKRLQTFMDPLPPGKYVGALYLCVEEIQGKKHIEFKFCEDKYDQVLGQYYLNETQVVKDFLIHEYPNTGMFFWYSILADVKITRKKMKLGSYLRMEKFTPEFFLVDFQYFKPYTENQISRIMCLAALFELAKITLESHFPGSQLEIISNGFYIKAPNTHTRVKISAVARYCLDKLGIGNSCNKTPRYVELKEKVYKDLVNRIMVCKRDMEAPMEYTAIIAVRRTSQRVRYVEKTVVEEEVVEVYNPNYDRQIKMPDHLKRFLGFKDEQPTVGWIMPALDYDSRTLNLDHFSLRERHFVDKRLRPLVEKDFDHYSGNCYKPFERFEEIKTVREKKKKEMVVIEDDYPDPDKMINYHKAIKIEPVCEVLRKISPPSGNASIRMNSRLEFASEREKIAKNRQKKKDRKDKRPTSVKEALKTNFHEISKLLSKEKICDYEDLFYVTKNVCRILYRRVTASGILYNRMDKRAINAQIRTAKERHRQSNLTNKRSKQRPFALQGKFVREIQAKWKIATANSHLSQLRTSMEYISPYITRKTDSRLNAGNRFKLFLCKRRLADYGIPWRSIDKMLETFDISRQKINLNKCGIPRRLKNLMRNIVKTVPKPDMG